MWEKRTQFFQKSYTLKVFQINFSLIGDNIRRHSNNICSEKKRRFKQFQRISKEEWESKVPREIVIIFFLYFPFCEGIWNEIKVQHTRISPGLGIVRPAGHMQPAKHLRTYFKTMSVCIYFDKIWIIPLKMLPLLEKFYYNTFSLKSKI